MMFSLFDKMVIVSIISEQALYLNLMNHVFNIIN